MQRTRLILALLVAVTAILAVYFIADFANHRSDRRERGAELGMRAGIRVAKALDTRLYEISEKAERLAGEILEIQDEEALLKRIRDASLELPLVLGVTVAFEPGRFLGKERYAPFFNKHRDTFQYVEASYDYTDPSLATARWYTDIVSTGQPRWSAPYYAEAAEAMLVDYGTPFVDERDEVVGIVDYAITLQEFTRIVDDLSVGEAGYGFTYEQGGAILSHPDPDYLLQSVFRLRDGKDEAILRKMREDAEGIVEYDSTYTYKRSSFFFRALESTGWKSVLVFTEDDLLGPSPDGRRKTIHVAIGVSSFLIALLASLLRLERYDPRRLWWMVASISLVIVGNIVFIWYLNVTNDFSFFEDDHERLVNKTIVSKYVENYDEALYKLTRSHYEKVPVGIFIESYEVSSFEASLIGRLWMKYPKALRSDAPPAFYFPDVSALESRGLVSELISEVESAEHVLVTWRFRATIEQDFSYQQFPFEQNDIQLSISYPDPSKNILLVPDLASYHVLNPSAKPGLNSRITVPSSKTIASFFTFEMIDYNTTFGNGDPVDSHPALRFNIVAKRIFLSPFIANIVPIMIVALIMFVVLCASSRHEDGRTGLTTMNVIQSSAGFLFILLLAHVNERARIETPEIAYLELFYFSMYLLITVQSILLAMSLAGSEWKIFSYRDNLILKLAFWPVLLSAWFVVTLVRFY